MIEAYPLCWPQGWKRTPVSERERGTFTGTPDKVRRELVNEVDRVALGARARTHTIRESLVISTNIRLREDGEPYANAKEPEDSGVVIYFKRGNDQIAIACDKYDRVWKNMKALTKTLEAMRGIERWGASELLDRAFTGFKALPAHTAAPWRDVMNFGINEHVTLEKINTRYRELAKELHPDKGGDPQKFAILNTARDHALQEIR